MKITLLTVVSDVPVGGLMVVYEYADRLAARGHRVTLVHGWPRPPVARALSFPPERLGRPPVGWHAIDPRVQVEYLTEHTAAALPPADIVVDVGCAFHDEEIAAALPRFACAVELILGESIVAEEAYRRWLAVPSKKICVGSWLQKYVEERGARRADSVYIPLGFDSKIFKVSAPIESRPPRIAMLYNPTYPKGADVGLAALERIRAASPEASAVLFGTGERPRHLPRWIDYRRLPERRELAEEIYNSAAIYLCPSRSEGFHLCGVEAMACGCALASTDIGGVRDYAEHEVTALLSPPEALAHQALRLLNDRALRLRIAKAGVARVAGYDWERAIDRVEKYFQAWTA